MPPLVANKQSAVLEALCAQYPQIRRAGFMKALRGAFPSIVEAELDDFARVPDGFVVRAEDDEVDVFEVEITHPLDDRSMRDFAFFWAALDSLEVGMRLHVVNRYGHINEVDLAAYYYHAIKAEVDKAPPGTWDLPDEDEEDAAT